MTEKVTIIDLWVSRCNNTSVYEKPYIVKTERIFKWQSSCSHLITYHGERVILTLFYYYLKFLFRSQSFLYLIQVSYCWLQFQNERRMIRILETHLVKFKIQIITCICFTSQLLEWIHSFSGPGVNILNRCWT